MGHTMRLDKIMIWISIHLHSLPPSPSSPSPLLLRRDTHPRSGRSLLLPFRISQSYARYHTNALLRSDDARFVRRRNATRTDGGNPGSRSARSGATKDRGERGQRSRISRDHPNEPSVCVVLLCVSALLSSLDSFSSFNIRARRESNPDRIKLEVFGTLF